MRSLRAFAVRFRNLFRQARLERDVQEELESNIRMEIDEHVRSGVAPEEARRRTLAKFGSTELVREEVRARLGIPILDEVARDIRYAVRTLRQHKGWTVVAVLLLALGIGVNTALFSILNRVLLDKLPVHNPDELIALRWFGDTNMSAGRSGYGYLAPDPQGSSGEPLAREATFSYGAFEELRAQAQPLAELFAAAHVGFLNVSANSQAELASGQIVSGNLYRDLGVVPLRGRLIEPADDSASAEPVAVISFEYWQRRFGMDPAVVGRSVTINTVPFTIIGVSPPEFQGVIRDSAPREITIPLAMEPQIARQSRLKQPANWWLMVMGRLKPDASASQLEAALHGVYTETLRQEWQAAVANFPPARRALPEVINHQDRLPVLRAVPGNHGAYDVTPQVSSMLTLLQGIAGMVLLLVSVSLANLLLSRGAMRQKEITVRLAIGAARGRVVRQLLTESLVLVSFGGTIGLLLAYGLRTVFPVWIGFSPVELDGTVLSFFVAVTTATGVAFGLLPAIRVTRVNLAQASRGTTNGGSVRTRAGKLLLVAQVAISLVLLVGAGLFLQTLRNLRRVDIGFNPENLVLFGVNPAANQYDEARTAALFENIQERARLVPGVRSIALSSTALLTGDNSQGRFGVEGRADRIISYVLSIGDSYLETMEIPLKLGRNFTRIDNPSGPKVAIVNETFTRMHFPDGNPLGKHLELGDQTLVEIVGIVGDARFATLRHAPPPTVYMPHLQRPTSRYFAVRTEGDAAAIVPAIRGLMRQIDASLPLQFISTQSETINQLLTTERAFAVSSSLFGILALTISMIGLFGMMSYTVARRTKEIGIRMALGAHRGRLMGSVIREALTLVGIGAAIGAGTALLLSRLLRRLVTPQLFGVQPNDPATLMAAILIMVVVAAAAAYLPARRASRVTPMVALRYE